MLYSVKRSQIRSRKQSSSHRCLLRSELTWNCRLSHEPQISISCQACPRRGPAATSSSSAGRGPTPMEIGWVKSKGQGKKGKGKGKSKGKGKEKPSCEKFEGECNNCGKWGHKAAICCSPWTVLTAWLSTQGLTCTCPKSYATHVTLQALPTCWRGLDLRSACGKMLKVWGTREVVYNAKGLHGKVFTVKIPFVVCEVRRPLLSLAMFFNDGCRKLGGHGREINLRRQGNSYLVDVEFRGGLLGCEKSMLRGPPGLVAPVDSGVAGLSATAGEDGRRAVTISTPEMPSREAV